MSEKTFIESVEELNKAVNELLRALGFYWLLESLNKHMLLEPAIVVAACIVFIPGYIALWRGSSEWWDWLIMAGVAVPCALIVYWMRKEGKA